MFDLNRNRVDGRINEVHLALERNDPQLAYDICEGYIRKSKNPMIFKVFMSLSCIMLGRTSQANKLVDEIIKNGTCDVSVLDIVGEVLKRLFRYGEYRHLYEMAYKENPEMENLGKKLFYSAIMVFDFDYATKLSLKMHSKFGLRRYYVWSVVSRYIQCQLDGNPKTSEANMYIVNKMVKRLLFKKQTFTFQELSIFATILGNDKLVGSFANIDEKVFTSQLESIKWRMTIWYKREEYETIIKTLNAMKTEGNMMYDWDVLMYYLNSHISLGTDKEAMKKDYVLMGSFPHKEHRNMHLIRMKMFVGFETTDLISNEIQVYFDRYGHQPSFVTDISPYIQHVTNVDYYKNHVSGKYSAKEVTELLKVVSALKIMKILQPNVFRRDDESVPEHSGNIEISLLNLYNKLKDEHGIVSTDLILLEVDRNLDHNSLDRSFKSIVLICSALKDNENQYTLKILIICLLREVYGVSFAVEVYKSLNIKFIQNHVLGHVILDWIPNIGFSRLLNELCDKTKTIYTENLETPVLVAEAFEYDAYTKIHGFIKFFNEINDSPNKTIIDLLQVGSMIFGLNSCCEMEQYFKKVQIPRPNLHIHESPQGLDGICKDYEHFPSIKKFLHKFKRKDAMWIDFRCLIYYTIKFAYAFPDDNIWGSAEDETFSSLVDSVEGMCEDDVLCQVFVEFSLTLYKKEFVSIDLTIISLLEKIASTWDRTTDNILKNTVAIMDILVPILISYIGIYYSHNRKLSDEIKEALRCFLSNLAERFRKSRFMNVYGIEEKHKHTYLELNERLSDDFVTINTTAIHHLEKMIQIIEGCE